MWETSEITQTSAKTNYVSESPMHHMSSCREISSMIRLFLSTLEVVQAVTEAKMVTPKKYSNMDSRELRINFESLKFLFL